jgi:hypothetical protein
MFWAKKAASMYVPVTDLLTLEFEIDDVLAFSQWMNVRDFYDSIISDKDIKRLATKYLMTRPNIQSIDK